MPWVCRMVAYKRGSSLLVSMRLGEFEGPKSWSEHKQGSTPFLYNEIHWSRGLNILMMAQTTDTQIIGIKIHQVLREQRRSAMWLASQLNCNRVNIYDIFSRQTIDTELLLRISVALEYDFFAYYSQEYRQRVQQKAKDVK